jgi:ubiquinone/menaquinone biosynthesis methyltransferase
VIAVDFSAEMLAHGASKFGPNDNIRTLRADARALPLKDESVDGIVAGFGLRNVPELPRAIAECARVLRPGGRLVVLDFFRPSTALSRLLQGSYNRFIVPFAGGAISGSKAAYRYLEKSIGAFMSADEFVALLAEHGFEGQHRAMFPPVANLVIANRREATDGR